MDEAFYEKVLLACELKKDIALFPFGDATVFFERSTNLMGGQKHRVQPARALFQEASVYFFDDPISAVEAHTGFHLLNKYCLGRCVLFMHSKTALFSKQEHVRFLSGNPVFLEGNREARKVLDVLFP